MIQRRIALAFVTAGLIAGCIAPVQTGAATSDDQYRTKVRKDMRVQVPRQLTAGETVPVTVSRALSKRELFIDLMPKNCTEEESNCGAKSGVPLTNPKKVITSGKRRAQFLLRVPFDYSATGLLNDGPAPYEDGEQVKLSVVCLGFDATRNKKGPVLIIRGVFGSAKAYINLP